MSSFPAEDPLSSLTLCLKSAILLVWTHTTQLSGPCGVVCIFYDVPKTSFANNLKLTVQSQLRATVVEGFVVGCTRIEAFLSTMLWNGDALRSLVVAQQSFPKAHPQ
eukprot:6478054-Amphidinium_carterae.2